MVDELTASSTLALATATYWQLAAEPIRAILERQSGVRHACEAETSMVLALRPELVDESRFAAAKAAEDRGRARRRLPLALRSRAQPTSGALGDPTAASAEKGERLLEAAATAVAGVLADDKLWALPASGPT